MLHHPAKRVAIVWLCLLLSVALATTSLAQSPRVDERPGEPGEWGFRPTPGETSAVTPPSFSWRPQKGAVAYTLEASRDRTFKRIEYRADGIAFNVHCPPQVLAPGKWAWRYRYTDSTGKVSLWSPAREFTTGEKATAFPLPPRAELLSRIPATHPRVFIRPEDLPRLRELAKGSLEPVYRKLVEQCERLLRAPPPTAEPPKYPPEVKVKDERWREIWWGNRVYTIRVLGGAATLGFTHLLDGNEEYGRLARKLLMAAAEWDSRGSTGYRYNDEAGMPYAYHFSRTYTFIHHLLTERERERCRVVMKLRGDDMYRHLNPRHLWRPYSSHSNRAWHFLGELGIAFHGEIEEAGDWVWFAMNVFANVYPVWSDDDGGWHEGISYWRSYVGRFTWWADIMKAATKIDAYRKPYFSRAGYWPMYLQPPGTRAGGFGDLAFSKDARGNAELMRILAVQGHNPYWTWYVEALDPTAKPRTYIDFVRGAQPIVEARPPADLPTSRLFRGVGQAVLNTDLLDGRKNVAVLFKASPFGTQSHGHEAQNSFQLYAFGQPLLIRTGRRDIHGSKHHQNWMWETKSDNSILVNGEGQIKHSARARAEITRFETGESIDYAEGEAGPAYGDRLERFTRAIVFLKPEAVIIFDRLQASRPSTFQWLLHAPTEMALASQHSIVTRNSGAACRVDILAPPDLKLTQTDQFDPPPRTRVKLRQFHLRAETPTRTGRQHFVTVIHPYREGETVLEPATLTEVEAGFVVRVPLTHGAGLVLLRTAPGATLNVDGVTTAAEVTVVRYDRAGRVLARFESGGR